MSHLKGVTIHTRWRRFINQNATKNRRSFHIYILKDGSVLDFFFSTTKIKLLEIHLIQCQGGHTPMKLNFFVFPYDINFLPVLFWLQNITSIPLFSLFYRYKLNYNHK